MRSTGRLRWSAFAWSTSTFDSDPTGPELSQHPPAYSRRSTLGARDVRRTLDRPVDTGLDGRWHPGPGRRTRTTMVGVWKRWERSWEIFAPVIPALWQTWPWLERPVGHLQVHPVYLVDCRLAWTLMVGVTNGARTSPRPTHRHHVPASPGRGCLLSRHNTCVRHRATSLPVGRSTWHS